MACLEFTVLYTHQKTKKSKVWQDGILKSTEGGNKATLLDGKGQVLDSIFLKSQLKLGDELESERYLITVEDGKVSETSCSDQQSINQKSVLRGYLKPFASSSLHLPVGLKRKNTGFQGPHVEKKMVTRKECEVLELYSSKVPVSSYKSHFQVSSPLFSVPYKKEGMDLLSTLNDNAGIYKNKAIDSDISLAIMPHGNEYKTAESRSINTKSTDANDATPEFYLDTKMINSGYPVSNNRMVSQNKRSKAQILKLLNHRQIDSKDLKDETEFDQQGLLLSKPSRIIGSLCQSKTVFLPEYTNKTVKETARLKLPLNSDKNVQMKSRWDMYMSLSSAEENLGKDDVENNDLPSFKEDSITESPFKEKWQRNLCMPSLEIENISAVRKSSVESLFDTSFPTESILNKGNGLETESPFGNIPYSNSVNALKTFQEKASKFNKHTVISDMDESCQQTQNDSYPVVYSENLSNSSIYGSHNEPFRQITEVNFNLLDILESSDTKNEEVGADCIQSQDSIDVERESRLFGIQKNSVIRAYSGEAKNKMQDKGVNYVSRSQPLHIGNEFKLANEMERSTAATPPQYSKTIVDKKMEVKAINIENMNDSKDLNCSDADSLIEKNRNSIINDEYHKRRSWLQETEVINGVPNISDSYSRNKSTEEGIRDGTKISQPRFTRIHHNTKPGDPLLAFAKKNSSDYIFQCISEKNYAASEGDCHLDFRPIATYDESPISKTECLLDSFPKIDEDKEEDSLYVKSSNVDSSSLPQWVNRITLLRSLTEHSTALESLQMIDENSITCERKLGKNCKSTGSEVKQTFDDSSCSENVQIPPPTTHSGSPKVPVESEDITEEDTCIRIKQFHKKFNEKQPINKFSKWLSIQPSVGEVTYAHCDKEMEQSTCPEDDSMSVLLCVPTAQTSVVTIPVNEECSNLRVYPGVKIDDQVQQSFASSKVRMSNKSKILRPEDRMCETFVNEKYIGERDEELLPSASPNVVEQKRQSKWLKYQNTVHSDLRTQNSSEMPVTGDIRAESVLGMPLDDTECQSHAINKSLPDFGHLEMIKSMLCKQQRNISSQDSVSEGNKLSWYINQKFSMKEAPKVLYQLNCQNLARLIQDTSELVFPSAEMVHCANPLKRQVHVPVEFQSSEQYKQIFTAALIEHLNIQLFELSQKLHKALGEVDISFYTANKAEQGQENMAPLCKHKIATKLIAVKKEGRNKGRLFYACDAPKADRCDFFKWLEDINPGQVERRRRVVLYDTKSIGIYLRSQKLSFYEECELLLRKGFEFQRKRFGKLKKFTTADVNSENNSKVKLYLKLNRKEHSSVYSKDDVWVVSRTLTFEPLDTFIACSVFFGPTSSNLLELMPLKGYSPSNWHSNTVVHALLVCNASTELTTLRNIEENVNSVTLPIMQNLLTKNVVSCNRINNLKFKSPTIKTNMVNSGLLNPEMVLNLANKMVQTFHLNKDQAMALIQIGAMMTSEGIDTERGKHQALPITIIHGVFGSGKSYLLAVVILFLVEIFKVSEADGKRPVPWKVLVSSSTNVAVDRVLLCLLDLGFEEFIRVGSIRKIAKPILPYSFHASSGPEDEQLKELLALLKEDLTLGEKILVKKTIEHHKLGTNKALLQQVKVVGATCAACPFPCMKSLKFPIVVLDESSQMTEPASLLPIARFECEKLVLVGDPKQLPPTIQGSESVHGNGLEQTLFDRLCLMGHEPILLRTQYRCHPAISAITKDLFYDGNLLNGISEGDRSPLTDWLPTLCFYNVNGLEQMEKDNSFYNMAEAFFTVKLIQSLIASGLEGSIMGVITLYKSQMSKIRNLLDAARADTPEIKAIQVSTVDAFQGAEKEIIVLSCIRTRQVGFIDSEKRVNVALTRGKRHLLIVGNLNCLRRNKLWGCVIQHCAGRENGLQHVIQIEQQLNNIITSFLEKKKEAAANRQQEKSKSRTFSQKMDEDTFLSTN